MLLPQTTLAGAATLAEQIRESVARGRIHRADGRESVGEVTLSVGVAVAGAGESMEGLIERADAAMYAAKRSGRNRVSLARKRLRAERVFLRQRAPVCAIVSSAARRRRASNRSTFDIARTPPISM